MTKNQAVKELQQIQAGEAEEFFYQHAGFSYDSKTQTADEGRRETARALAAAEAWGQQIGLEFSWEDDWSLGTSHAEFYSEDAYPEGEPETCETCLAILNGDVVASLSCIDGATDEYRRVVEAELAAEVMDEQAAAPGKQMEEQAYRAVLAGWGNPMEDETWTRMLEGLSLLAETYAQDLNDLVAKIERR
jgi:hypothetical protein